MISMRDKTTWHYLLFKYNVYKPIRNYICDIGYGYDLSDEDNTRRRKEFIRRLKI